VIVTLYGVGRNLNRAYRTCEAFGVETLHLWNCTGKLSGNLYAAKERVEMQVINSCPCPTTTLALETSYRTPLSSVDWGQVKNILIGGETRGVPRRDWQQKAVIPMWGKASGLTVEAALAIALYEWRKHT
jgi:tRNA G18 (ribose-2'-O)-methylase SpoU